ncbi:MAG TPA: endonuclease/exonuclease/phosphatase family protein [Acidimicrobiales bacterium]|nr:endonuclease/exonuclease/phosphatase family protein [Acidimicrobiales bacterium]
MTGAGLHGPNATDGAPAPQRISVATLNCRNTADRWKERTPLLVRQLVDLRPEVIGLQELRRFPSQGRTIGKRAWARGLLFDHDRANKTGIYALWEGIAVLSRLPVVDRAKLELGGEHRVAQRVTVVVGGGLLDFYNTHLASGDEAVRTAQARRLLDWMAERSSLPQVLVGDFNARPGAPSIQLLAERLRSAHMAVHGREPDKTVPTPLRRGASGRGSVLDYVFVNSLVEVHDARRSFEEADPHDEHLVASDHYGLAASVSLRG